MLFFKLLLLITFTFGKEPGNLAAGHKDNVILTKVLIDESKCDNNYHNPLANGLSRSGVLYELLKCGFPDGLTVTFRDDPSTPKSDFDVSIKKTNMLSSLLENDNAGLIANIITLLDECQEVEVVNIRTTFTEVVPHTPLGPACPDESAVGESDTPWLNAFYEAGPMPDSESTEPKTHIIPASLDISEMCGAIRNQGSTGACMAFAADAQFAYYELRDNGAARVFSPKYFYYHRNEDNIGPGLGSMAPNEIEDVTKAYGTVEESLYPYVDVTEEDDESIIPLEVQELGAKYGAENYGDDTYVCEVSYFNMDLMMFRNYEEFKLHIKALLNTVGPIAITVDVHRHGQCDMWNPKGLNSFGGHALAIVGYDSEGIRIRNSWDTDWCDDGYTDMSWIDAWERVKVFCWWDKAAPGMSVLDNFVVEDEEITDDNCGHIQWGEDNKCGPGYKDGRCTEMNEKCDPNGDCTTDDITDTTNSAFDFPEHCLVGCDGVLGSGAEEDVCGICEGDGTSCMGGMPIATESFTDAECSNSEGVDTEDYLFDHCYKDHNVKLVCKEDNTIDVYKYEDFSDKAVNAEPCGDDNLLAMINVANGVCTSAGGAYIKMTWEGDCNGFIDCDACENRMNSYLICKTENVKQPECVGVDDSEIYDGPTPMDMCVQPYCEQQFQWTAECVANCRSSAEESVGFSIGGNAELADGIILAIDKFKELAFGISPTAILFFILFSCIAVLHFSFRNGMKKEVPGYAALMEQEV